LTKHFFHLRTDDILELDEVGADFESEGIEEAKQMASSHAGVLVVRRDGNPVVGEEGDPVVVYRSGKTDGFD